MYITLTFDEVNNVRVHQVHDVHAVDLQGEEREKKRLKKKYNGTIFRILSYYYYCTV